MRTLRVQECLALVEACTKVPLLHLSAVISGVHTTHTQANVLPHATKLQRRSIGAAFAFVTRSFTPLPACYSYPLDTIKTRLHLGRALGVPSLPDMYRGLASSLVGQVPYGMLTFGTYEIYKTALLQRFPVRPS